ncbi:YdcF family protein [Salinibacillus aidingensis]|uniref:YdcF family protein n=1 Tax=Salinibacillus aidingensis TaxID=237684 RepID=A0ABN1B8K2_9BACI
MHKINLKKLIVLIFLLFFLFLCFTGYSIWSFSRKDQTAPADAAIVLGAAAWGEKPSPVLQGRIDHAISLYEQEYVNKIIFTGGQAEGASYAESEVARDYAVPHGIPEKDILIETQSEITEDNLIYAAKIAQENGLESFLIVSDPLHMKRAMLMAEQTGLDANSSPAENSAYETLESKIPFFFRELFFYSGYIVSLPFRHILSRINWP